MLRRNNEYASFLKVGAASLILRMLEERTVFMGDMTLENPIRAIREISHDITCTRKIRLASGRELSALDVQSEFLEKALKFADRRELTPEEKQSLNMWEHCITGLKKDPLSLSRECDWVTKFHLIEKYNEKHGLDLADPKIGLIDLQYHDVNRQRALLLRPERPRPRPVAFGHALLRRGRQRRSSPRVVCARVALRRQRHLLLQMGKRETA